IARGLVAYDAADAVRIAGLKTAEIETVLGYEARSAMIHRDDLVVSHSSDQVRASDQVGAGDQVQAGDQVVGDEVHSGG
ncbi:MAG: glutamate 5-kinase, partial [Mesorhizobium sp.]